MYTRPEKPNPHNTIHPYSRPFGSRPVTPPQPVPTPPGPTGEGTDFVYSTLLRRAPEPPAVEDSIRAAFTTAPSAGYGNGNGGGNGSGSGGGGGATGGTAYPYQKQPHHHHKHHDSSPYSHTARPATPSAQYATKPISYVLHSLNTDSFKGLDSGTVPGIRALHGPNEFEVEAKEAVWRKFLKQFYESPLNLLLLGSAGVSAAVGNRDDAVSIAAAIIIVVTVGFVQEQRSEKSLEALNKLVPHYCHLVRDGLSQTLLANVLVPGDLVTFSVGDRIPADVRLIRANNLAIDESTMTGETTPADKHTDPVDDTRGVPDISERHNTALMGTLVRSGNGAGVVVATGRETEFGVIFGMMMEVEDRKTPLQLSMDELATKLSGISFGVIGVICLIGVWQKRGWLEMFTIGVSLAVAAIPEGLPIVVTVTLALGVLRMSKRKAIVKKLPSVETLGSVSVICSDKTGTLTANQMTVTKIYTPASGVIELDPAHTPPAATAASSEAVVKTCQIANICANAYKDREGMYVGMSTEVAMLNVLGVLGLEDCREKFTRRSEIPFSSDAKFSSVTGKFNDSTDRDVVYVTGASEVVLAKCKFYLRSDGTTGALDTPTRSACVLKSEEMAKRGLRVLGMAYGFDDDNLIFSGMQAMMDPPRQGVAQAISTLQAGGVRVIMITGDSEHTALAIAQELGIKMVPGVGGCLSGKEVDLLSQRQLIERVPGVSVFARVTPRHKMAIIEAFQARGAIVAMTGDGVNDAPALRMADIGISMGKGATDVAKEAADVILVDDNFATILPAVEEGKTIFYNIQNFLGFQLSTAVAALSLISISTSLHLQTPLNAMQILFINILMDGPPSQSLGVDPVNREVMRRPPRSKNAPVITKRLLYRVAFSASMIVFGTLFVYMHELSDGRFKTRDQTMTFTSFVFLDLVSALQNRGLTVCLLPALNDGASRRPYNKMLLLTVSVSFLTQLMIIYLPVLQGVFQTEGLSLRDLGVLLVLAATSFGFHEARRTYERKLDRRLTWDEDVV